MYTVREFQGIRYFFDGETEVGTSPIEEIQSLQKEMWEALDDLCLHGVNQFQSTCEEYNFYNYKYSLPPIISDFYGYEISKRLLKPFLRDFQKFEDGNMGMQVFIERMENWINNIDEIPLPVIWDDQEAYKEFENRDKEENL